MSPVALFRGGQGRVEGRGGGGGLQVNTVQPDAMIVALKG